LGIYLLNNCNVPDTARRSLYPLNPKEVCLVSNLKIKKIDNQREKITFPGPSSQQVMDLEWELSDGHFHSQCAK
jgi:hypothetical protein